MARKQQVILLHGNTALTSNTPNLKQGEVAIYNGVDAKSTEFYATDSNDGIVAFPSKAYVEDRVSTLSGTTAALDTALQNEIKRATSAETANAAAIKAISDDYLTSADKDELHGNIDEKANSSTVTAIDTRLSAVEKDYLKEEDKTGLTNAINTEKGRIDGIVADYLKAADKTELQGQIDGLDARLETAEGNITSLSGTVGEHTTTIATLATKEALKEVADSLSELKGSGDTSVTALAERVAANETAISKLDDTYLTDSEFATFKQSNTEAIGKKADTSYVDDELAKKVDDNTYQGHISDTNIHVTAELQSKWNTAAADIEAFLTSETGKTTAIDTLKEIQDFLSSDDGAVQTLIGKVDANEANISTLSGATAALDTALQNEVNRATSAETANAAAIKAISDDYLKAADKTELQGNIDKKADSSTVSALNDVVTSHTETLKTLATSETVSGIDTRLGVVEGAYVKQIKWANDITLTPTTNVIDMSSVVIDCGTY